jgi:hypothetical protein
MMTLIPFFCQSLRILYISPLERDVHFERTFIFKLPGAVSMAEKSVSKIHQVPDALWVRIDLFREIYKSSLKGATVAHADRSRRHLLRLGDVLPVERGRANNCPNMRYYARQMATNRAWRSLKSVLFMLKTGLI